MSLPAFIRDLERLGMSQAAIGAACGTSGATICRIKLGKRKARYEIGKAIERLYFDLVVLRSRETV